MNLFTLPSRSNEKELKGRFGGFINMVAPRAQKKEKSIDFSFLCLSVTDYRTIVEDFYKVVEFVEWLKEFYPEKIPLIIESK